MSALLEVVPALAAGVLYARRTATLDRDGRPVPPWRRLCFAAGLLLATAGVVALGGVAGERFAAHMAEHLLLGDLAALLLVLGVTGPVLQPVLRVRWLRALAHPAPALLLWAANLALWHLAPLHEAAVEHGAVHALQHALFVALGVNVWMPLFGPLPTPPWFGNLAKLGYIVGVRLLGAVLGNVLLWTGHPLYDVYDASDPLADQTLAAAIMMVEGSLLTLVLFGWLVLRAAREGEERQALLDLARDRGVELSERRAARAVAAGRGAELRRRIEDGDAATPRTV
ncbi:MAG TPA: cytochrome c oxidase assembly protein [Solirubrobacteraceae bacterium]|nr:cytochrome c oxidase assembly protein [Solirubrobacteraceae bacterium]